MTMPLKITGIHHVALICSDYEKSKAFYTEILGFRLDKEVLRKERLSYKADLSLNGKYTLELFSFPNPPKRVSRPEACGLRHIAFAVDNLEESVKILEKSNVTTEVIRIDEYTNKKFTFIFDPDELPIELYEL